MLKWLMVSGFCLVVTTALAQQNHPKVTQTAVAALQAQVAYQQAVIEAMQEDTRQLAEWWAEYVKGLNESTGK